MNQLFIQNVLAKHCNRLDKQITSISKIKWNNISFAVDNNAVTI